MKIGVFGGTFNPIHVAHVRMAQEYARQLELDRLILMPTYIPPHKKARNLVDAGDRLMMCHIATADLPLFEVSDYEISRQGKSYTYKTLKYLQEQYPGSDIYLLMGADMFLTVQDWRLPQEIFRMATLCAAQREKGEFTLLHAHKAFLETMGARCLLLDMEPTPLSSTMVRNGIMAEEDVSGLIHPGVWDYIVKNGLYTA